MGSVYPFSCQNQQVLLRTNAIFLIPRSDVSSKLSLDEYYTFNKLIFALINFDKFIHEMSTGGSSFSFLNLKKG